MQPQEVRLGFLCWTRSLPQPMVRLATVHFDAFPIWLSEQEGFSERGRPTVCCRRGLVVHGNSAAVQAGISAGMSLQGALQQTAELQQVPLSDQEIAGYWEAFLAELYGFSPWLYSPCLGVAQLKLSEVEAAELAAAKRLRLGLGPSLQVAQLAAVTCRSGRVRSVAEGEVATFLATVPSRFLTRLGLPQRELVRLGWLGIATVGALSAWSQAQLRAFLGPWSEPVLRLIHGPAETEIPRYTPPEVVVAECTFEEPAFEPGVLEPALRRLAELAAARLAGRAARRVSVRALFSGVSALGTRLTKGPVTTAAAIFRYARLALAGSGAAPVGIDELRLQLAGLRPAAVQSALWQRRERREVAEAAVLARFPSAIVRPVWIDRYSQAPDRRYRWERRGQEGEREQGQEQGREGSGEIAHGAGGGRSAGGRAHPSEPARPA